MIINGQRYEAEPAVEAYVKNLQAENEEQRREILRQWYEIKELEQENARLEQNNKDLQAMLREESEENCELKAENFTLKAENAQLEEKYQKATGVIAMYLSANAEPAKHGHWIDNASGQECSVCGEMQYGFDNFRNYCANCGAKMDGGEDNAE